MKWVIVAAFALLSGCSTLPAATLENRVGCTLGGDKGVVVSMWGWIGLASVVSDKDADIMCTRMQRMRGSSGQH